MDDTRTQEILLAAAQHNVDALKPFLREPGAASVQDPETGTTPLHAAIAGCEGDVSAAKATLHELFLSGAIWNDLDANGETPGCLAWRLQQRELYDMVVAAGVRAELLHNLMGGYEPLDDEDDDSARYLKSELTFADDKLLDDEANGVMMAWETDIMRRSVDLLCPRDGLRILNVGFGMGIVDGMFADTKPASHHIIEAHPAVQEKIKLDRATIHAGRWQDVLPQLQAENQVFDVIYFDTFGEDYSALKEFFTEYVISLLDPNGRFGFFNGLGADRQVCYDVYTKVVELDLCDAGLDVEWHDVEVKDPGNDWHGVKRRYWTLDNYRLPVCVFMGS